MRLVRPVLLASVAVATFAIAGCSGPTSSSAAGPAVEAAGGGGGGGGGIGELPAGEPPADCPVAPRLSVPAEWETTTEEQDFQVSHQCSWTAGEEGGEVVATLMSTVVPRPSGMEGPAVKAFEAAPCEDDACTGAATFIEPGAFAKGVQPSDAEVILFADNPGRMHAHGREYEFFDATAWVVTEENMCVADLSTGMLTYDPAMVDTLLAGLRANAAATCGVTLWRGDLGWLGLHRPGGGSTSTHQGPAAPGRYGAAGRRAAGTDR